MSSRYKVYTESATEPTTSTVTNWDGSVLALITSSFADVLDYKTGNVYELGALRKTVKTKNGKRTRTFIGENRHNDAHRWTTDLVLGAI